MNRDLVLLRASCVTPADQSAVQSHGHHLGGASKTLFQKTVESVLEVAVKLIAAVESLRGCEAHVVAVQRVGDDEMVGGGLGVRGPIVPASES